MYPFCITYFSCISSLPSSSYIPKVYNNMSTFSHHNSTNLMLSLKVVTISTSLFFIAMLLKLFLPQLTSFALSDLPSILNLVASWLKPPYLYLVINCIIITIVATSKLQSKFDHYALFSPPPPLKEAALKSDDDEVAAAAFDHFSFSPPPVKSSPVFTAVEAPVFDYGYVPEKASEFELYRNIVEEDRVLENKNNININVVVNKNMEEEEERGFESKEEVKVMNNHKDCDIEVLNLTSNKVISRAPAVMEFSKPPASARFGHRKVVKTTPDQGGKTLKVSKPKRHETLESTWKTITDGRPMPLTRHLRKSDTWENHPAHTTNAMDLQDHSKMAKSETFYDRKKNSSMLSRSSGSAGKLKKDPSLSQDELNKRVEAFITKFNEDMRLQRQESLNQYMEMINRGAGP